MSTRNWLSIIIVGIILLFLLGCSGGVVESVITTTEETLQTTLSSTNNNVDNTVAISLPPPAKDGDTSLEEALLGRRSVRSFTNEAITLAQLGQLLWAGQGVTDPTGKRTAPSAGATYPLKLYAVVGNLEGISVGIYLYDPPTHTMSLVIEGDQRQALSQAALGQTSVSQGAVVFVITAVYEKTTKVYGDRGIRYVHLEAGHAAQNICLEAVALMLGTVTVGAFDDAKVSEVLALPQDETPLYIIPAGNKVD